MSDIILAQCLECNWIAEAEEFEECCPNCEAIERYIGSEREISWYDFWRQCEELKGKI